MKRWTTGITLVTWVGCLAFSQPAEPRLTFDAADVHVSAKTQNQYVRNAPARNGRYEVKTATMLDLIRIAYSFDPDKIVGGPNWLELDRFDVIAKLPPDATTESQKRMLQSLLQDRFQLVTHKDTKPLPTNALIVGKKPLLKEAAGTEQTGCRPQEASGAPGPGVNRLTMSGPNGVMTTINMGPGMTVEYNCRNVTMEQFAANLRGMIGANLGPNDVIDDTGLKGAWNFDLRYSLQFFGGMNDSGEHIPIGAAIEKQLGLKLEERQVPTPVIVVDKANRKPSENPPGTAEALPEIPAPTEFEVASVKPADPTRRGGRYQTQPGGRMLIENMGLRFLVNRAFNTFNNEQVVGLPGFADTDRYDINAKAPAAGPSVQVDMDAVAPMMLALLKDRFQMKYHTEERPVTAYSLVAAKPKLKKADPDRRIFCKNVNAPPGAPPGSRVLKCQNITMALFVERLQGLTQELNWPVSDATGMEGGWDLSLTFSMRAGMVMAGGRGAVPASAAGGGGGGGEGGPAPANVLSASDSNDGYTIFEAIEKQLGLKLEKQKRPMPVFVIDHIEQKPTEN